VEGLGACAGVDICAPILRVCVCVNSLGECASVDTSVRIVNVCVRVECVSRV